MVDRPARVVAQPYGQAGRSISRPVSANPPADLLGKSARLQNRRTHLSLSHGEAVRPVGRACFRQDQRRLARTYLGVCPSPIAFALTKALIARGTSCGRRGVSQINDGSIILDLAKALI